MKIKFSTGTHVTCSLGDGEVMENNPSSVTKGNPQYRVRIDFTDYWVEEKDIKNKLIQPPTVKTKGEK